MFQEVKQYYEEYQQMKQQQKEEAEAEQDVPASNDHPGFHDNCSLTGGAFRDRRRSEASCLHLLRREEAKGEEGEGGVPRL